MNVILLGAGGHAKVIYDMIREEKIIGFYDDKEYSSLYDLTHLGTLQDLIDNFISTEDIYYICCIGDNEVRFKLVSQLEKECLGIRWINCIKHPSVIISKSVQIGQGTILCAGSIIQPDVKIGNHCIINTSSSIDHDCCIGDFSHIAPGTHLCGNIQIGKLVFIGVGVSIIPEIKVGDYAVIGAGTTVIRDISENMTVFNETRWRKEPRIPQLSEKSEQSVNWVPKKHVSSEEVFKYLSKSESTNQYTNYGPCVKELESYIRNLLAISDDKSVIVTNNATSALFAIVSGINLYHDREMKYATQAFTFPCSVQGPLAKSVIVDIDMEGGLDLTKLTESEIDGIIVTNCFGNLVDIDKYVDWASQHSKILLFDNAACPYSFYKSKNSLNFGNGSIVSFHHTKMIGFGEGGSIIIDKKYEHAIRRIINFGYDVVAADYKWHQYGSNYKMSDISAVWILAYLENNFAHLYTHNIRLQGYFQRKLDDEKELKCRLFPHKIGEAQLLNCITVLMSSPVTVEDLQEISQKYSISLKKYYHPLQSGFQITQMFWDHIICFPCHNEVTYKNIDTYIEILKFLE